MAKKTKKQKRTKDQHYVARLYLRGFTVNNRLFCFDKKTLRSFGTTPEYIAHEKDFYELPKIPGVEHQVNLVEKALGVIEGHWKPKLDALIESAEAGGIDFRQAIEFAPFVVMQWIRTKTFRDIGHEIYEKAGTAYVNQVAKLTFPEHDVPLKFKVDKDGMADVHAKRMFDFDQIKEMAASLERLIWVIGINKTEHPFYTSDTPVIRRANRSENGIPLTGANDPGIEFVFPLDSTHILLMLERSHFAICKPLDDRSVILKPEQVDDYNSLMVMRSNQRVFCAADGFDLARKVCDEHPEVRDPNRSRVEAGITPPDGEMKSLLWVRVNE